MNYFKRKKISKFFSNSTFKFLSISSLFLFLLTGYLRTRTLKPWNDEFVSLVSGLNFYYERLDFIGPFNSQYYISYSPKLTAGPISSIGGVLTWPFFDNIYLLRFSNLLYLIILSVFLISVSVNAFSFKSNNWNLGLVVLIIFSIMNTSWWYGVLYFLPETISAVLFAHAVLLFGYHRKFSIIIMSTSIFFGDFLTVLMFVGFYLATIIKEKSLKNLIFDAIYASAPLLLWVILVLNFSDFNLNNYLQEYFEHYFKHRSAGEVNLSTSAIINNFLSSEVINWGLADFLRILLAPVAFGIIVYNIKSSIFIKGIGKLQIVLPVITIFLWFWLLSPAKSIIYSGLFTTYILIFLSYFLIYSQFSNKLFLYITVTLFSLFFSSTLLVALMVLVLALISFYKVESINKNNLIALLLVFIFLNQLNVIKETSIMETHVVNIESCKISLKNLQCEKDYYFGK